MIRLLYTKARRYTYIIYHYVRHISFTIEKNIKLAFQKQYTQKPVWLMSSDQGTLNILADEEIYTVKSAPYWGHNLLSLSNSFRVPPQWNAMVDNAYVHSPSAAVMSHDILWQQEEVTALPSVSSGYSKYITQKDNKFSIFTSSKTVDIPYEAALIAHRTDFNFFHTMFEVIPKIIRLKETDPQEKIPVLLNNASHQNINDLLKAVIGKRPIISLKNLSLSKIQRLHFFSTPSFLPDDPVFDITKASLSCESIPIIQNHLIPLIMEEEAIECLWVSRQGYSTENRKHGVYTRDIDNIEQVNEIIEQYKSERFYPEKYSWKEQGQKFRSAKRIVMASGSAIANLVYCKPGTRVLLMCKNKGVNPALFFPIFEALEIKHAWVFGDSPDDQPHTQFKIDQKDLAKGMDWLFEVNTEPDGLFP